MFVCACVVCFICQTHSQEYLERYYMLIAFTGYLASPHFDPGTSAHVSFPTWMAQRPELRRCVAAYACVCVCVWCWTDRHRKGSHCDCYALDVVMTARTSSQCG